MLYTKNANVKTTDKKVLESMIEYLELRGSYERN